MSGYLFKKNPLMNLLTADEVVESPRRSEWSLGPVFPLWR